MGILDGSLFYCYLFVSIGLFRIINLIFDIVFYEENIDTKYHSVNTKIFVKKTFKSMAILVGFHLVRHDNGINSLNKGMFTQVK